MTWLYAWQVRHTPSTPQVEPVQQGELAEQPGWLLRIQTGATEDEEEKADDVVELISDENEVTLLISMLELESMLDELSMLELLSRLELLSEDTVESEETSKLEVDDVMLALLSEVMDMLDDIELELLSDDVTDTVDSELKLLSEDVTEAVDSELLISLETTDVLEPDE